MKLVIDLFSKGWVHKDFNIEYISNQSTDVDLIVGRKGSDYIKEVRSSRNVFEFEGVEDCFKLFLKILVAKEVTFLVMLNKYIPLVLFSRMMGKKVFYVVHKYNLTTRKRRNFVNFLYNLLGFFGVKSISLEEPYHFFRNNIVVSIDMWKNVDISKVKEVSKISKVAFIGKPVDGKNFALLKKIADKKNLEIVIYSDDNLDINGVTVKPFTSNIAECDVIWGYYDDAYYKGIQSGLCYPSLESGLKVITNGNVGFKFFSTKYSDYLIEYNSVDELFKGMTK
ncbi:hypothetical protein [Pseudoalteromonas apostichopi]|uniref:hypothetical protein n=1 Tax=Pseudoalteromonas apostichopi TaxID=3035452 RepID=UPI0025727856|nr:hypothetical protein [Pseudoalteromonas sp. FE4]